MVDAVKPGGHLLITNCFYPVILCHLSCTFHVRYSFDSFCGAFGLEVLGPCEGSYATIYRRSRVVEPNRPLLRAKVRRPVLFFLWREWKTEQTNPWRRRAQLALSDPMHYPRKLFSFPEKTE
jgi:hypothetical protein